MIARKKSSIFILDTSAILSGKTINLDPDKLVTTPSVSNELQPGGRDYRTFLFLQERGLAINIPSNESIKKIHQIATETGDINRLSKADIEVLALALDVNQEDEATIITDDYSIQNVANELKIKFNPISQDGITKSFKWTYRCSGCGKKFNENIKTCPICGALTKNIVSHKKDIKR